MLVGDDKGATACVPIDSDGDGVLNGGDLYPGTLLADADLSPSPAKNRYWAEAAGRFVDDGGAFSGYTIMSKGCSRVQIIWATGLGAGSTRHGLSRGELANWVVAHA